MNYLKIILVLFLTISATQAQENLLPAVWDVNLGQRTTLEFDGKHVVLVFISPECPLCQNYVPTFNKIATVYSEQVAIYGIIPGRAYNKNQIAAFKKKYGAQLKLFVDSNFSLTRTFDIRVTPEAVLLDPMGKKVYSGAIDNWVVALGKQRQEPTQHYLMETLEASLLGNQAPYVYKNAVGCTLNDY